MRRERFPAHAQIDFSQCDTLAVRKLVTAIFLEAITEADLTLQWAHMISASRGRPSLAVYTTSIHYIETHTALSKFLRCGFGTELLDWMNGFSEALDPEAYWVALGEKLDRARFALGAARRLISQGPPKQYEAKKQEETDSLQSAIA